MTGIYICPGCGEETVMQDARAGSYWCSNMQCNAKFTRPTVLPDRWATDIEKMLTDTLVLVPSEVSV